MDRSEKHVDISYANQAVSDLDNLAALFGTTTVLLTAFVVEASIVATLDPHAPAERADYARTVGFAIGAATLVITSKLRRPICRASSPAFLCALVLSVVPVLLVGFIPVIPTLISLPFMILIMPDILLDPAIVRSLLWTAFSIYMLVVARSSMAAFARISTWRAEVDPVLTKLVVGDEPGSRPAFRTSAASYVWTIFGYLVLAATVFAYFALREASQAQTFYVLGVLAVPADIAGLPALVVLVGGYLGYSCLIMAGRLRLLDAASIVEGDDRKPIVLLRSFSADGLKLDRPFRMGSFIDALVATRTMTLEEVIVGSTGASGPVVAIGRPDERLPQLGAAREYLGKAQDWRVAAQRWIHDAAIVVAVLGESSGLYWEFQTVREREALDRLIIVFPPDSRKKIGAQWRSLEETLGESRLHASYERPWLEERHPWPLCVAAPWTNRALVFEGDRRDERSYAIAIRLAKAYVVESAAVTSDRIFKLLTTRL